MLRGENMKLGLLGRLGLKSARFDDFSSKLQKTRKNIGLYPLFVQGKKMPFDWQGCHGGKEDDWRRVGGWRDSRSAEHICNEPMIISSKPFFNFFPHRLPPNRKPRSLLSSSSSSMIVGSSKSSLRHPRPLSFFQIPPSLSLALEPWKIGPLFIVGNWQCWLLPLIVVGKPSSSSVFSLDFGHYHHGSKGWSPIRSFLLSWLPCWWPDHH